MLKNNVPWVSYFEMWMLFSKDWEILKFRINIKNKLSMLKISILTEVSKLIIICNLSFLCIKKWFLKNKYFFTDQIQKIEQSDVLIIDTIFFYYEYSKNKINNTSKLLKLKKKLKLVYFDTSDSTG